MKKSVLLFDLGGVIIRLGEVIFPKSWHDNGSAFDLSRWLGSQTAKAFETGQIGAIEFGQRLKSDLALDQSVDEILDTFAAWPEGFFDGAAELLAELKNDYTLAALSNINELHGPRMLKEFALHKRMDRLFFSHELGLSKPDPKIFLTASELLGVECSDIVFFDDVQANVEVAKQVGMTAHRVDGPSRIKTLLGVT